MGSRIPKLVKEIAPLLAIYPSPRKPRDSDVNDAKRIYRVIVRTMIKALQEGDHILIQGLGSFHKVHVKARRRPCHYMSTLKPNGTGKRGYPGITEVPAHNTIKFKPARELLSLINQGPENVS